MFDKHIYKGVEEIVLLKPFRYMGVSISYYYILENAYLPFILLFQSCHNRLAQMGWFKVRYLFSYSSGGWRPRSVCQHGWFLVTLSFWLADGYLLIVFSKSVSSVHRKKEISPISLSLFFFIKTVFLSDQWHTFINLFSLNYFLKVFFSNYSHLGVQNFNTELGDSRGGNVCVCSYFSPQQHWIVIFYLPCGIYSFLLFAFSKRRITLPLEITGLLTSSDYLSVDGGTRRSKQ